MNKKFKLAFIIYNTILLACAALIYKGDAFMTVPIYLATMPASKLIDMAIHHAILHDDSVFGWIFIQNFDYPLVLVLSCIFLGNLQLFMICMLINKFWKSKSTELR